MIHALALAHANLAGIRRLARKEVPEAVLITSAAAGINHMRKSVV